MSATITRQAGIGIRPSGTPSQRDVAPCRVGARPVRGLDRPVIRRAPVSGSAPFPATSFPATSFPATSFPAAVSEATYRRRRTVAGIVLAVLVAASVVLAHDVLAGSGGVPASAAASQPARARTTVTARPGDTLWSIAERHHGEVSLSRYVDTLVDLNGGASIMAGQAVVLP